MEFQKELRIRSECLARKKSRGAEREVVLLRVVRRPSPGLDSSGWSVVRGVFLGESGGLRDRRLPGAEMLLCCQPKSSALGGGRLAGERVYRRIAAPRAISWEVSSIRTP